MNNILRTCILTVCVGSLLGMGVFAVEYYGEVGRGEQTEYYGPAY